MLYLKKLERQVTEPKSKFERTNERTMPDKSYTRHHIFIEHRFSSHSTLGWRFSIVVVVVVVVVLDESDDRGATTILLSIKFTREKIPQEDDLRRIASDWLLDYWSHRHLVRWLSIFEGFELKGGWRVESSPMVLWRSQASLASRVQVLSSAVPSSIGGMWS